MTVTVGRHAAPQVDEQIAERLKEELERSIQKIDASPALFGMALNEAVLQSGYAKPSTLEVIVSPRGTPPSRPCRLVRQPLPPPASPKAGSRHASTTRCGPSTLQALSSTRMRVTGSPHCGLSSSAGISNGWTSCARFHSISFEHPAPKVMNMSSTG